MKATLNLVLTTKDGEHKVPDIMIPIIGDTVTYDNGVSIVVPMELSKLDKITSCYVDGHSIRNDPRYKDKIDNFLEEHQNLLQTFKSNKNGSLVVVFTDETDTARKMRVLYNNKSEKTDPELVLKGIKSFLDNTDDANISNIVNKYKFMFGMNYPKSQIFSTDVASPSAYYAKPIITALSHMKKQDLMSGGVSPRTEAIKWIYKRLKDLVSSENQQSQSLGYYYIRLIDAHLKRKYEYETSPVVLKPASKIKTKIGTITTASKIEGAKTKLNKTEQTGECVQLSFFDSSNKPVIIPDDGEVIKSANNKTFVRKQSMDEYALPHMYEPRKEF